MLQLFSFNSNDFQNLSGNSTRHARDMRMPLRQRDFSVANPRGPVGRLSAMASPDYVVYRDSNFC